MRERRHAPGQSLHLLVAQRATGELGRLRSRVGRGGLRLRSARRRAGRFSFCQLILDRSGPAIRLGGCRARAVQLALQRCDLLTRLRRRLAPALLFDLGGLQENKGRNRGADYAGEQDQARRVGPGGRRRQRHCLERPHSLARLLLFDQCHDAHLSCRLDAVNLARMKHPAQEERTSASAQTALTGRAADC